jgi:K+/H+ antiporter YhaU regulatory subunit KhtT
MLGIGRAYEGKPMNKDRLKLCKDFATAKTIEEERKDRDKAQRVAERETRELAQKIARLVQYVQYKNRPWYKRIF